MTYALVYITWVFFRAHGFGQAWVVLRGMFGVNADAPPILTDGAPGHGDVDRRRHRRRAVADAQRTLEAMVARQRPLPLVAGVWASWRRGGSPGAGNAFIYFQF